jgi:uncharacterized protein YjiS (DUF1127 family)
MSTIEVAAAPRGPLAQLRAIVALPAHWLDAYLAWRRRREGIRLLLELDDRLLRDAGFIRAEIERLR